ncbi:DUF4424 family protein [Citromicrobium bathyomarinum]|uniref:DUF4424 family protein n=1 Tax=Citromicrobium bathyomarinum TaxID=72174 RepID=UPI001E576093|nr:DUF4424 family protein [Citromicrobium bathyomarinum]
MPRAVLLATAGFLLASPIAANDSEAEISVGGITLTPSGDLRLVSEDLYLSADKVTVDYLFENPTGRAITTTIAFPMPSQPRGMLARGGYYETSEDWSGFGFATRIDGRPVRLLQMDRARIGDRDVTEQVIGNGWPVYWTDTIDGNPFANVPGARLATPLADGMAIRDPLFEDRVVPAWEGITYFVREQTFPPNSKTRVNHEYAPMTGGSVGGALYPQYREDDEWGTLAEYRGRYCVDDHFLAGVDRRLAKAARGAQDQAYMQETWLGYVLSSGANWNGPIERFRLVVDKGSPDNLVSFCMVDVTKIGPTQFEVVKTDFEPTRDLNVLIVEFYSPAD